MAKMDEQEFSALFKTKYKMQLTIMIQSFLKTEQTFCHTI